MIAATIVTSSPDRAIEPGMEYLFILTESSGNWRRYARDETRSELFQAHPRSPRHAMPAIRPTPRLEDASMSTLSDLNLHAVA